MSVCGGRELLKCSIVKVWFVVYPQHLGAAWKRTISGPTLVLKGLSAF